MHVLLVWCCAHGFQDHKENATLKTLLIGGNEIGEKGESRAERDEAGVFVGQQRSPVFDMRDSTDEC